MRALVGDDDEVGETRHAAAERRALAPVAAPGGPQHDDEAPGGHRAQERQHAPVGADVVGEVDEGEERLARVDPLQAAREAVGGREPADRRGGHGAGPDRRRERGEGVGDLLRPEQPQPDLQVDPGPAGAERVPSPSATTAPPPVGGNAGGRHRGHRAGGLRGQSAPGLVVDHHHRGVGASGVNSDAFAA